MFKLSIIILSYNTKDLLEKCLASLDKLRNELSFQVIVIDNASYDSSAEMVAKKFPWVALIRNEKNLGFAAGNNKAENYCKSEFVLFLNSDTLVPRGTLSESVNYISKHKEIGALTCKILLPDGKLDQDSRRAFITPWIGFTHLVLKLDKIFPESKFLAPYWYGYVSHDETHEVDVLQGAFFLTRKKILDEVGWFDEDYFLDGEDVDLCWRIKEKGWKILYYPKVTITHFKGASKGKVESQRKNEISLSNRLKFRMTGVDSMEIFYRKRLWKRYPLFLNILVLIGIKVIKFERFLKTIFLG